MTTFQCFEVQQHLDVTVVHLTDQKVLERLIIDELREELLQLINQRRPQKMVINFAGVTHCSSELLGALILVFTRLSEEGGLLLLCGVNPQIREVFRITRLENRVFGIEPTVQDALQKF